MEKERMMKRKNKTITIILTLGAVLALSLSACNGIQITTGGSPTATPPGIQVAPVTEKGTIAEGHIEPKESRTLGFAMPGTVAEVMVKKGDKVQAGQELARLKDSEEAQAAIDAASVEIEAASQAIAELERTSALVHAQAWTELIKANQAQVTAQEAWDAIDTQETQDKIEEANTELADAEKVLKDAQDDFDPYKSLPEGNEQRKKAKEALDDAQKTYDDAVVKRDTLVNAYDLAKATLEQAQAAQAEAQHHFDQTNDGPDPDQLRLAELRKSSAESRLAASQAALDNLVIKAPFSGEIMDTNILADELVSPSTWAFVLADTSEWYVRTNDLTELEVVKIEEGQVVDITPDALPDLNLQGTVEEISQVARTQTGDVIYDVLIKLNQLDPLLRWGMTTEVNFSED